ncbi:hypothetical protein AMS62_05615 [Bacillus sp. FJAT-18019]|nr:hypothetical protein AMS62_05615 [Bacillus sp. FJAT-18019]
MKPEKDGPYLMRNTELHGQYLVKRIFAQSELSLVYLGRDRAGSLVVIKEFYPRTLSLRDLDGKQVLCRMRNHQVKFDELRAAFIREAETMQRLSHPHIVRHECHFEENGTVYIVMEYLRGRTMERMLQDGKLSREALLNKVLPPLIAVVQFMHGQGCIHSDIKPANVMILKNGGIRLIDLGSASWSHSKDAPRTIMTSAGYSPLELYSETSRQGPHSDVYSLCATIYAALGGQPPPDIGERLIEDRILPIRQLESRLSPFLSRVIMAGLSLRERRPSLSLLKAALLVERYRWNRMRGRSAAQYESSHHE